MAADSWPTPIHQLVERQETAPRKPTLAVAWSLQLIPFQISVSVAVSLVPTLKHHVVPTQEIPPRLLLVLEIPGRG
jgi:hypothetical protein